MARAIDYVKAMKNAEGVLINVDLRTVQAMAGSSMSVEFTLLDFGAAVVVPVQVTLAELKAMYKQVGLKVPKIPKSGGVTPQEEKDSELEPAPAGGLEGQEEPPMVDAPDGAPAPEGEAPAQ